MPDILKTKLFNFICVSKQSRISPNKRFMQQASTIAIQQFARQSNWLAQGRRSIFSSEATIEDWAWPYLGGVTQVHGGAP